MNKHAPIQLDEQFAEYVEGQVSAGNYESPSDVVAAALRLYKENEDRIEALKAALDEGEASGIAEEFDLKSFLARMHRST